MTLYNGYGSYNENDVYGNGFYENRHHEDYNSDDDYDISVHCRNYSPGGSSSVMNMSDYNTCDNCRHQRADNKCVLVEKGFS